MEPSELSILINGLIIVIDESSILIGGSEVDNMCEALKKQIISFKLNDNNITFTDTTWPIGLIKKYGEKYEQINCEIS